ncbi:hypothetical protein Tco_0845979 [Tanacetum coccineum]
MKESEAYKTYHDLSTGKMQPKPKYVRRSSKSKTKQAPKPSPAKRVKATAKVAKSGKKKQPAHGLETLSEVALTEAEQMKLVIEISKTQFHSSQPSGSGAYEGTCVTPGVPGVPKYASDEEEISWKSSDDEDDDDEANIDKDEEDYDQDNDDDQSDDNERTDSDNDGENFVHPKFLTYDDEARQEEEVNEEDSFDPRVQTPSHFKSTNDKDNDDETQGVNVEEEEMDEEATNEEGEGNEFYKDVNFNLEGRDVEMTDAQQTNVQTTQVTEDTHVIITPVNPEGQQQNSSVSSGFVSNMLNPTPDSDIDSLFNLNTESTSLIDVSVTTLAEPPLLLKAVEDNFSEFKQTNQFAEAVSSIPGIVDAYLSNKMHETVKVAVQLQSDRLREEAQAENDDFLNKLDDGIKKIIKEQVKVQVKDHVSKILPHIEKLVNNQLESEVLTRSSNESTTSHAIAAKLSELERKKILIDKMESNKSIHRSDKQKNLYKALVDAYESNKLILDTYGDIVLFKRRREMRIKTKNPPLDQTGGPREDVLEKNLSQPVNQRKRHPRNWQEFNTEVTEDQPNEETLQFLDWFQRPTTLPSPDRDWNKTLLVVHGPVQPWLSTMAQSKDPRESFNELMDTPFDFSSFLMNRLKVDALTLELLAGPTFELMKGSCKSLTKLKYLLEEVYKATTKQLDEINPKGQQHPHDLRKPLPLISNSRGRRVIRFAHFINNDLKYLSGGVSSHKYANSVTKTKAADYGHIK